MTVWQDNAAGAGGRIAIPGARAVDHAGFAVPDLDEAVSFFSKVLGAMLLWQTERASGDHIDMRAVFNATAGSTPRIAMMRLGPDFNVELIEWTPRGSDRSSPMASDTGIGHLAIGVADIDAAVSYLDGMGVRTLDEPRFNQVGVMTRVRLRYFLSPWGMPIELVQQPDMLSEEPDTEPGHRA